MYVCKDGITGLKSYPANKYVKKSLKKETKRYNKMSKTKDKTFYQSINSSDEIPTSTKVIIGATILVAGIIICKKYC